VSVSYSLLLLPIKPNHEVQVLRKQNVCY